MPLLFNIVQGIIASAIRQEKETTAVRLDQEKKKPCGYSLIVCLYILDSKKQSTDMLKKCINLARLPEQGNTQESVVFL